MMERAVTLLPLPDSPTIPIVSPGSSENETPSTALTTPSWVLKYVLRLFTSSIATAYSTAFGSRASRKPSPRKLTHRAVITIKSPGNNASHHCSVMVVLAS
jgi:hypothetical protein